MLSHEAYSAVPDFEWALSVLIDLAYVICGSSSHPGDADISQATTFPPSYILATSSAPGIDSEIAFLLKDLAVRVRAVRPSAASLAAKCIADDAFWALGAWEVVGAAVWICGEYAA
jgi:hypothetical protein